jgi:taurine dioxygenase
MPIQLQRERAQMSDYQTITVEPVTPRIGAMISGVNLSGDLGNQQFQEIHDALMSHEVIFFRDQHMTLEQHKAFGALFGQLDVHPGSPGPEGHREILVIHADENSNHVAGDSWHSDVSCIAEPPMGSILHLNTIPEGGGGDTLFASAGAAYDALSDTLKAFLEPLTAIHAGEQVYRGRYKHQGIDDSGKTYPESEHPVVRTHPVSGRKSLYVNETFTTRIPQLAQKESDAILKLLCDHIKLPQFQVRFKWQENSVAFWDNRSVQHHAMWDYFPEVRSGYRVTVKGDKPA